MCKAHTFQTCLVVYIHVVELQLAELPAVIAIENILINIQAIVEAETDMADSSVGFCLFRKGQDTGLLDMFPTLPVQRMEQIHIDMVGLQPFQFLSQNPIKVFLVFHHPNRQFCS